MAQTFIPANSGSPEERQAKAIEYIASRMGSIDDTLLKLLKAVDALSKKK